MKTTHTYIFNDGHKITSKLNTTEVLKRMKRLDTLRVLTECFSYGTGLDIFKKTIKAYNKKDNFTGIIKLTMLEKDFLSYFLENGMLTENEIDTLKFYLK